MELRQLRYFVRIVELGGMGKAAVDLGVATAALSQQMARLEKEVGVRLLLRQARGTVPTAAGQALYKRAQMILRQVEVAAEEARHARLTGAVSIGLSPATAALMGGPLLHAMHERYPEVQLHLVEAFSGYLSQMLHARQLDLAVLFHVENIQRLHTTPLLRESLYVICSPSSPHAFSGAHVRIEDLDGVPLILPSRTHGMRAVLDAAFGQRGLVPNVVAEIDSLLMLLEAVRHGYGLTVQQSAVAARPLVPGLSFARLSGSKMSLQNLLVGFAGDEASAAATAARTVIQDTAIKLVREHRWVGAVLTCT